MVEGFDRRSQGLATVAELRRSADTTPLRCALPDSTTQNSDSFSAQLERFHGNSLGPSLAAELRVEGGEFEAMRLRRQTGENLR